MSAILKWTTFKLHYNITNTDEAKIIQNNELNILICLKYATNSSFTNPTYELLTLSTDIGAQEVEVPIKSTAGQFPFAEFCLVGYHILKWQSLITNLSDATLAEYTESSSTADNERLINDYVKDNSEIAWTAVGEEGDDHEEASINNKAIYNNYITVTGDFLGENVNPLTKISRWSLGNMANRWKNIYSNKVICDYTYCDAILPQENYIKNSQYLRATWSVIGTGDFADPINFVDQKITSPDTIFEAWEVSSGIYSIKINNNTYYLKLADFNVNHALDKMVFDLYTDIACTIVASDIPKLERFHCPNMWRYFPSQSTWVTTNDESLCQYKEIKIGNRNTYSGITLPFYCYPSSNEDQRIYCDCTKTGADVVLSTPLVIHNKEVTTADFFIPNVVYISQTKAISTVGTVAKPYEQAHIKKVQLANIQYTSGSTTTSQMIIAPGIAPSATNKTPIILYGTTIITSGNQNAIIDLITNFPFLKDKMFTVKNVTATQKGIIANGGSCRMLYVNWGVDTLQSYQIQISRPSDNTTGAMTVAWNAIIEIVGDLEE